MDIEIFNQFNLGGMYLHFFQTFRTEMIPSQDLEPVYPRRIKRTTGSHRLLHALRSTIGLNPPTVLKKRDF